MLYSNRAGTVLGSVDTVDWTGIDWAIDEPRPELEFGKPYLQLGRNHCTECKKKGDFTLYDIVWSTKHYHETQPLGHLTARCQAHQDYWVANPDRGGARRISDVAPEDRTAEENEWMAARNGSGLRPAVSAPSFHTAVCPGCFTEQTRNGTCFC